MRRHPRYATATTLCGLLMVLGGFVACEKRWLSRDTSSLLVSFGGYAIARRRTEAQRLDYLESICMALYRQPGVPRPPVTPGPPR